MSPILAETILAICGIVGSLISFYLMIFRSGKKEANIDERVTALEKSSLDTARDIKDIKENHLSHIQDDMNKINLNLAGINTTLKIRFEDKE